MCLFDIVVSRNQPHFTGCTIRLIDVQYKLLVHTMSRPNLSLGFGFIGKGALEGLRIEI